MPDQTKAKKAKAVAKKKSKSSVKKKSTKKVSVKKKSMKKLAIDSEVIPGSPIDDLCSPPLEEHFIANDITQQERLSQNIVSVKVSQSLGNKLRRQAEEEGISLEDFVTELLSEGVVLRAWEIVERKNQMRTATNQPMGSRSGSSNSSGNSRSGGRKGGRMSHGRYQSIMDDKATFLEYVRNQERSRR